MSNVGAKVFGGTGTPPIGQSIGFQAALEVCRPTPGIAFNIKIEDPPRDNCPNVQRDLANFPLNHATTTTGDIRTFGDSEMYVTFIKLSNYPRSGGTVRFQYFNPSNALLYDISITLPIPDPGWTWWYATAWATIGHFDNTSGYTGNEIVGAGQHYVRIQTTFGTETIYLPVIDSSPPPPPPQQYTIEVRNSQAGSGNFVAVYKNGVYYDNSKNLSFFSFSNGDQARFEAMNVANWTFSGWVFNSIPFSQNPLNVTINGNGVLTANFAEIQDTSGYTCVDNCAQRVQSGAPYRTQAECMASDCYQPLPPPPGTKLSLSADKGVYLPTEIPIFTAKYDPKWAGKSISLSYQEVTGGYTQVAIAIATASGITQFEFKPNTIGQTTFISQIFPCAIVLNCETSNKVNITVSESGTIGGIPYIQIGLAAGAIYLLGQLIGGRR